MDKKSVYVGDVFQDQPSGQGKLINSDGGFYEGRFKAGKFITGKARVFERNGDKYEGNIYDGLRHGEGELTISLPKGVTFDPKDSNAYNLNVEGQIAIIGGTWTFGAPQTKTTPVKHLEKAILTEDVCNQTIVPLNPESVQ